MKPTAAIICALILAVQLSSRAEDTNWPQFRGPDGRGVSANTKHCDRWSDTQNVAWKTAIPGRGWSSPVVWGNNVFLTTVINSGVSEESKKGLYLAGDRNTPQQTIHDWKVLCVDLNSGKVRWEKSVQKALPLTSIHIKNSYASETPSTDGERVYACFGGVGIFCFDFEGKELWNHPLEPLKMQLGWGTASSPVLHGEHLYYLCDNNERSYLLALNKRTGKMVWREPRKEKSNWTSPFIWQNEKRTEIVTAGSSAVRSYDLDGKVIWSLKGMSTITIPTPYAADGLLYISSGYVGDQMRPVYAIRPGAAPGADLSLPAGTTSSEFIAWSNPKISPYNPSTLVHDGRLIVLYDRGLVSCFNAKTGSIHYEKQSLPEGRAFTASPWAMGDKIYCLNENGVCFVLRSSDKFELLHTNILDDDMCMATPAIAGGSLLIRTSAHLYCIRKASDKSGQN